MLPRIVLFVLQLIAAWYLAPAIKGALPVLVARPNDIFIDAILYALIILIVGFVGSLILKGASTPSSGTFTICLLLALVLAGLTLVPQVTQIVETTVPALRGNRSLWPLLGAVVGYVLKR